MRILIVVIYFILVSCESGTHKKSSTVPANTTFSTQTNSFDDNDYKTIAVDSIELKRFWSSVVQPILSKDKAKVLSSMDFPVFVDWENLMRSAKNASSKTPDDFLAIYDRFFNPEFLASVKSITFKDIPVGKLRDTTWYTLYIGRPMKNSNFEVGMSLDYFKTKDQYKLKFLKPISGDFYGSN